LDGTAAVKVVLVSAQGAGSGKTRWVEALTRRLRQEGHTVAVIKHHGHGRPPSPPHPRKDTQRALAQGATAAVLASPWGWSLEGATLPSPEAQLRVALAALVAAVGVVEVVLAEGFRSICGWPRLWVGAGTPPPGPTLTVVGPPPYGPPDLEAVVAWLYALPEGPGEVVGAEGSGCTVAPG
jgi:molybdopterin-guanine dinucleotide biosynthesis protein MobB